MAAVTLNSDPENLFLGNVRLDTKTVLVECPLFDDLASGELELIAPFFKQTQMTAGDWIFREGADGTNLYIVADGQVVILKESAQRNEVRVAIEKPGRSFGEMALIDGEPRSASALCTDSGHLLMLTHDSFEMISLRLPSVGLRIYRKLATQLSQRLRQATGFMVDHLDH